MSGHDQEQNRKPRNKYVRIDNRGWESRRMEWLSLFGHGKPEYLGEFDNLKTACFCNIEQKYEIQKWKWSHISKETSV